ncbi:MAG: dipeptidyl-peptidase 3 family protein [Spirochaetia bacterium]
MDNLSEKRKEILSRFKNVTLSHKNLKMRDDIRKALPHLKKAMDSMHEIFLLQQDEELAERIKQVQKQDDELGEFYRRFQGPWYPVEEYKSYDPDVADRDPRCAFYPKDMTKEEYFEAASRLSDEKKEEFESPASLIRREGGELKAVPYHQAYAEYLSGVFDELEAAADAVEHEELSEFLKLRAESLVTGGYRDADAAWVQLKDTPLELVLGPYEVYADALLGRKATYESFLMLVDQEKCDTLAELEGNLDNLAAAFPLPEGSKPAMGTMAPMIVVHQIYAAGEATQPIFAAAFNLPNDPWVRGKVGWKQIMLYNVMEQKFDTCTAPIGSKVLAPAASVEFDPYFYFVLLHEVSHGLGPAYRSDGKNVDNSLGAHYTPIEEAKADSGGLYLLLELGGKFGIPKFPIETVLGSYVAGLFRSMRFGIKEAHGAANVIEHNWLLDKGVIERTGEGYKVHPEKAKDGVKSLLDGICELQAKGTEKDAELFLDKWAQPDEELLNTTGSLSDIPVDIFIDYDL